MIKNKMRRKSWEGFFNVLNTKPVIGVLIFVMLSFAMVFAGNVIVKEGSLTVENNFNSSNVFFINQTTGKVGIGINNPRALLDISTGSLVGTGLELPHVVKKVASANIRNSHNAEATTNSLTPVKLKTITLTNVLVGQQRILFDIKSSSGTGQMVYGRV